MSAAAVVHNHSLQSQNTLAVPAFAEHYLRVSSTEELLQALNYAHEHKLELLVLGGGSNVLLPERFAGLVVQMAIKGIELVAEDGDSVSLCVGAGELWQDLVNYSLQNGYSGLENLALIPGTVGAAPIQNIGAYGVELDSVFLELRAVDRNSLEELHFNRAACEFSYRDSVFKNRLKDKYIITQVSFRLSKSAQVNLSYAPLKEAFAGRDPQSISAREVGEAVCRIRQSKLPDPAKIPNAGSFFKNPIVDLALFESLRAQYPDIAHYPVDATRVKIAAAWLLDKAGWRGHSENGMGMHVNQALVLVNPGRRPARELLAYAERIQTDIFLRFGIYLEPEPVAYQVDPRQKPS